jgi:PAS domain S-box-containing protein
MPSSSLPGDWTPLGVGAQFDLLTDNLTDSAIYLLDSRGRVGSWNPGAERLLGYAEAEILGRHCTLFYPPADRRVGVPDQELRSAGRGRHTRERWQVRKGGAAFWAHVTTVPVWAEADVLYGYAQLVRDLSDQRESREARRASEERFRALFDQTVECVLLLRPDGTIIDLNRAALELREPGGRDVVGRLVWDGSWVALSADARERLQRAVARAADGTLVRHELELPGPDGRPRVFDVSVKPVLSDAGRPTLLVAEARDITEWKRLEAQLRQAQKMDAMGKLASGVAHDFNNVLTVVIGFSQLILRAQSPEDPARGLLNEIVAAAERATGLTRQLLSFGGRPAGRPQTLHLNTVVAELEKMLRRLIGEHVDLRTDLDATLGAVRADRCHLEQILLNLVVNARDALPPDGGVLTVRTYPATARPPAAPDARPGPHVVLEVRDTGHGMTPAVRDRIFEPFFTTKEPGRGTGLGLSTVYGIVKQAGGFIEVVSAPEAGTTFKVYLPEAGGGTEAAERVGPSHVLPRGRETVLLVEDEPSVRTLARVLLLESGYTVLEARDGRNALSVAQQYTQPIHLLVTDVVMPELGGQALAEQLRLLHPELKVLFLSGYPEEAILRHGVFHEHHNFLPKPFSVLAMARKVRELLDRGA